MSMTEHQVRAMSEAIGLSIPDDEIPGITLRLDALMQAMEAIEKELGSRMDETDPLPPVYPRDTGNGR